MIPVTLSISVFFFGALLVILFYLPLYIAFLELKYFPNINE